MFERNGPEGGVKMLGFLLEEYERLMETDSNFAEFVRENKDKSAGEILEENGIDEKYLSRILS